MNRVVGFHPYVHVLADVFLRCFPHACGLSPPAPSYKLWKLGLIAWAPPGKPAHPTQGLFPLEGLRDDFSWPLCFTEEEARAEVPLLLMPELGGDPSH